MGRTSLSMFGLSSLDISTESSDGALWDGSYPTAARWLMAVEKTTRLDRLESYQSGLPEMADRTGSISVPHRTG
jgi:hypothetical protein